MKAFDEHSTGFVERNYTSIATVGGIGLTPRLRDQAGPSFAMPKKGRCMDVA
jgi:hypothetical protein